MTNVINVLQNFMDTLSVKSVNAIMRDLRTKHVTMKESVPALTMSMETNARHAVKVSTSSQTVKVREKSNCKNH